MTPKKLFIVKKLNKSGNSDTISLYDENGSFRGEARFETKQQYIINTFYVDTNLNTVTIQKDKQSARESGFDGTQEQEAQNTICTHPGNTCTQEGAAAPRTTTTPPTPTPSNCNGVEDKVSSTDETDENSIGDPDTPQPPGVVCPQGEDEPAD